MNLWPFQIETVRRVMHAYRAGAQSVLLQAPTGSGKTVMSAEIARLFREFRMKKSLFLAHRREIVMQSAAKLEQAGMIAEIIMDGCSPNPWGNVIVGSQQTIHARKGYNGLPEAEILIVDEAHRIAGRMYDEIFQHYRQKGARILLLTATPIRSDGRGLKQYADVMVCAPPVSWLMEHRFLVPTVDYRVGIIPSEKGLKTIAGEWNQRQVEQLMDAPDLIGDITATWMKYAQNRRTMCFASGVHHSIHLVEEFRKLGIRAAHVDAETPKQDRDLIYDQSESGQIQIVSNADVYTEGTDFPWIDCIIHAKKWKSIRPYLQQGGRGMRAYPGKQDLLFLDHSGVVYRHGRLELDREWELTNDKEQAERMALKRKKTERAQIKCPHCGFLLTRATCSHCGFTFQPDGEAKRFLPGTLLKLSQEEFENATAHKAPKEKYAMDDKQRFYSELLGLAKEKGKGESWVKANYRSKFQVWPKGLIDVAAEPSQKTRRWIHDKIVEYFKKKESKNGLSTVPAE